jgi:PPOX class probable F420-dependent enzyme
VQASKEVAVLDNKVSPFEAFADQKTVIVTTYRRDGTPVDTPVHVAVEGGRAYIRTYAKAMKARRLRRNPQLVLSLASSGTRPAVLGLLAPKQVKRLGEGVHACARPLTGEEERRAARALARKYPLLQGVLIPLAHRLMRTKTLNLELVAG